jgi:hypothetical protein
MTRTLFSVAVGFALLSGSLQAADDKGQTAKVKKVDEKTSTLIVTTADGKTLTFKVEKDVKIVGPRGGVSEERLKDDRLVVGSEITIFLDGKNLKQIKLGFRRKATDKDKVEKDKEKKDK